MIDDLHLSEEVQDEVRHLEGVCCSTGRRLRDRTLNQFFIWNFYDSQQLRSIYLHWIDNDDIKVQQQIIQLLANTKVELKNLRVVFHQRGMNLINSVKSRIELLSHHAELSMLPDILKANNVLYTSEVDLLLYGLKDQVYYQVDNYFDMLNIYSKDEKPTIMLINTADPDFCLKLSYFVDARSCQLLTDIEK